MVRLVHTIIVVLKKTKANGAYDEERIKAITGLEVSRWIQIWNRRVLEHVPDLTVPFVGKDFSLTSGEVSECYEYLLTSNHEEYRRWG